MAVHYGVAAVNIAAFFVFVPCNLFMAFTIFKREDFWNLWIYRIVLNVNIVDVIYLLPSAVAAAFSICGFEFCDYATTFSYLVLETAPVILQFLCVILALNRLVVFARFAYFNRKEVHRILFLAAWMGGVFWLLLYVCTMKVSFAYNFDSHAFQIESFLDDAGEATELQIDNIKIALSAVSFSIIILCSAITLAIWVVCKQNAVKSEEVALFFQTLVPNVFLLLSIVANHFNEFFDQQFGVIIGLMAETFVCRIVPAAIHASVLIVTNTKMRRAVVCVVSGKKPRDLPSSSYAVTPF